MRTSSLGVSAQQRGLARFKKDHRGCERPFDLLQDGGKAFERLAFANIDDQRGTIDLRRLPNQIGKTRQQLERQVVYGVVAQILEGLQSRGLPRAGQASENDEFTGLG